jgi:hypothetical protein
VLGYLLQVDPQPQRDGSQHRGAECRELGHDKDEQWNVQVMTE